MGDGCRRWRSSSRPFAGAESGSPGRALEAGKRGSPWRAVQAGIRGKRLNEMDVPSDKEGKIRNERIRGTSRVVQASKKITEKRFKWYGHVRRMKEEHIVR